MAVIGVKSITGITSITNAAGGADVLTFHSNNTTERVRIDSDGRLMVGTTTPGNSSADDLTLHNSGNCGVTIRAGNSSNSYIFFADGTSSDEPYRGFISYFHNGDFFKFGTAGTERARIDSSGNVNFGAEKSVALPSGTGIQVYNSSAPRIKLVNNTTGNGATDGFQLYLSGSGVIFDQKESAEMRFYTSATERLRIASDGKILMGVAANNGPAAPLHIYGGSDTTPILAFTRSSTHDDWQGAGIGLDDEGGTYKGALTFYTHGSSGTKNDSVIERLRIDSSGHMGLGISPSDVDSIGKALNIASSTGGAIYLQDTDAPTTKFAAISYNGGTAKLQIHAHHSASFIDLGTNGTQRINITSTGEVLIGSRTAKPNDINKLVVTGTSPADAYDSQCYLEGSETSGAVNTGGALAFGGHDGSSYRNWANIYGMKENSTGGNTAAYMAFHTRAAGGNPAEKMRISSAGYVTTPQNPKFWYSSLSNTSSSGGTSNTEILKFATERHNQGSNYNTSNGRFTAPVSGTYWFSFNGLVDNSGSSSHYWAQLWRNGSQVSNIGYTYSNNGEYEYFGGSACIYLAKDDYAQIYASANIHDGNETSFSGFLIG